MMYSQNDKNGVLEVVEIKTFFAIQPWWTDFLIIFAKFFPQILYRWHLCKVIKKGKNDLSYLSTIGYSKSPIGNKYNIKKTKSNKY